ncbi:hypothetical protein C8J57DRAFT_382857 [Mycena rebaudengoi]|nr:hypothetical protein C8J57DRAFT_382857 [Mycena rebaudengoi]
MSDLQLFLDARNTVPARLEPACVKEENIDLSVKLEAPPPHVPPPDIRMRTLRHGDREILELLSSDSEGDDAEPSSDLEVSQALLRTPSRSSSIPPYTSDIDISSDGEDEFVLEESATVWQNPDITSKAFVGGPFRITQKVKVQCLEVVTKPASIWPIGHQTTAFILNLDPEYDPIDQKTGLPLHTVDYLIKNSDNESWKSYGTGRADNNPMVFFDPGQPPIACRRARMSCNGCCACENIDPKFLPVERYDLDPASRNAVSAAEQDTRRREGTTAESRTAGFFDLVIKKKCAAKDAAGNKCRGKPKLMPKLEGATRGHDYWVACDGWRRDFQKDHRTFSIPDYTDQVLLVKLFANEAISVDSSSDTPPCSRIVHSKTGLKLQYCPHSHIINGRSVPKSQIKRFSCNASRTIYVPLDSTIRQALIIHKDNTPHNHPMPPLTKVTLKVKEKYRELVEATGSVGATVNKVDYSHSTKLLLNGITPALFSPALQDKRVKREIVHRVKTNKYPAGLGVPGAFQLYLDDLKKPLDKRYIHCCHTTPDGGVLIITGVPYLIKLLDDPGVLAFEDDTTFKRVAGEMNEWELALFFKAVLRATTVIRAYINRASADFFEILFDEVQKIKKEITGKVLGLKRFVRGGNLLVMNADMEAAQVLGAARSVMKTNDPEYSDIPSDTPASVAATYFVKVCYRHSKEAIHDFKGMVTPADYARLMDFMYIDSKDKLEEFSKFVKDLGVKKIQDWWAHKEMSDWILPCLVKSQSNIFPQDWDSTPATTNTGETQHHWTNSIIGIKLPLVEAIESARELDERTALEIQSSMNSGILSNPQNEAIHRASRSLQRQTKASQKVQESNALTHLQKDLTFEIAELQESRRQLAAKEKARFHWAN